MGYSRDEVKRAWVAFYNTRTGERAMRELTQNDVEIEFAGKRVSWPKGRDSLVLSSAAEDSAAHQKMPHLFAGVYYRFLSLDWLVIWFRCATDALMWLDRQSADDARRGLIEHAVRKAQRGAIGWGDTERSVDAVFHTLHPERMNNGEFAAA